MPLSPTNLMSINRAFVPAADNWYQLLPLGEFPANLEDSKKTPITFVVDQVALNRIVDRFKEQKASANFTGYLVDYEHFSLNTEKKSEAAAWIEELEVRADGLWGRFRLTPLGDRDITGGVYRHLSPVTFMEKITTSRYRPIRLESVALTNAPNLSGMVPLSNRRDKTSENKDGPPAGGQKGTGMNYKDMLCKLLGLPPESTDEQIQSASDGYGQEVKNRKDEVAELKAQNKTLSDELIESDLATYGDLVANREELKANLVANRKVTIATLKSLKPATVEAGGMKMLNRKDAKQPQGGPAGGDTANKDKQERRAEKVKNRAHQIMKEQKVSFTKAFASADKEIGEE